MDKFYSKIVSVDPEEVNEGSLSYERIYDLQLKIRQKEYKKRTLNRLLMKVGNET